MSTAPTPESDSGGDLETFDNPLQDTFEMVRFEPELHAQPQRARADDRVLT